MNAFMLWARKQRCDIRKENSSLHNAQISKILGERWRNLDPKERLPYVEESNRLMKKHKIEHPNYHYKRRKAPKVTLPSHCFISTSPTTIVCTKMNITCVHPERQYARSYYTTACQSYLVGQTSRDHANYRNTMDRKPLRYCGWDDSSTSGSSHQGVAVCNSTCSYCYQAANDAYDSY